MTFLARLSLANRGLVALITVAILGFGAAILPQLRQQMFPDLQFPSISVIASYPGATPEVVEQQVAIPIEQAVSGIDDITMVTSASRTGSATVWVNFDYGVDVEKIAGDIEQAIARIDNRLPQNVDPMVIAGSTDDIPVILLASTASQETLKTQVIPELAAIDGVREATLSGTREQRVLIDLNMPALRAHNLTIQQITAALTANGVSIPGGVISENNLSHSVTIGGKFTTLSQLQGLYLNPTTTLSDVAKVTSVPAEQTTITRTNGKPTLGISVTAIPGGNAVAISHAVTDKLPALSAATGSEISVIFDQAPEVERSIKSLSTEGLLGLAFAVLVILVFLLSVRSTLVTAVSIPVSVVIALIALWTADYSLNMLTLGGLTIAIGRVVDDSIVVLENIKRHLALGEDKKDAILNGVREVAGAVTASTLTTVAVFLPIALVGGLVGQFFGPFGLTVTAALLASLFVSLTIVPVLAYWFLKKPKNPKPSEADATGPMQRAYVPVLRAALRFRWVTIGLALLVLLGTGFLAKGMETSFIGGSGSTLQITQSLPSGASLATTDEAVKKVEQVLSGMDEVKSYQVSIGGGGNFMAGQTTNSNKATYRVTSKDDVVQADLIEELRSKLDGMTGEINIGAAGGGFGSSNLEVQIEAPDPKVLATATEQVRAAMASLTNVTDVKTDLATSTPQVQVTLDRPKAAALSLTDAAVGQLVSQAFKGMQIVRMVIDGVEQPVVLRTGAAPTDLAALRALPIGPGLTLDDIADVAVVAGPTQINRVDEARTASVTATPNGGVALSEVNAAMDTKLKSLTLPAGASYTIGGVTQSQEDAFNDLAIAMMVAIALVFIVMIGTFRGIAQPLILLISIPFAATGALGLLAITGDPIDMPAMIGLLMLIGIVVTNAIVLMDLINQYRKRGMSIQDSILEGGRRRLRPILMTAVATIFALLPMSLGATESSAFISQPLAIVVIGGLISSTLLTLILVPVLYSLVEGAKDRFRRKPAAPAPAAEPALPELGSVRVEYKASAGI